MTTNYRRGADFERKVLKYVEARGWFAVRSAGSHSPVDVVAIKGAGNPGVIPDAPTQVLYIQCKKDGNISPQEWADLLTIALRRGGLPLVAFQARRGIEFYRILDYRRKGDVKRWVKVHLMDEEERGNVVGIQRGRASASTGHPDAGPVERRARR